MRLGTKKMMSYAHDVAKVSRKALTTSGKKLNVWTVVGN
jgi:hypothetical protein